MTAIAHPFTDSRISFVRLCERHESALLEREIVPSIPGLAGGAIGMLGSVLSGIGGALASATRMIVDMIDTGRFPETALLDKLPAWQRDSNNLLDKLMSWQTELDAKLEPLGVVLQGQGVQIASFDGGTFPKGYEVTARRLLSPGMQGGGASIIGEVRRMVDTHRKFFTKMLKELNRLGGKAAADNRLPEGVDLEEITAGVETALDALDGVVEDIVAKAGSLGSVAPAGPGRDVKPLQDAVASIVTPLNQIIEVLQNSLLGVQGMFDTLVTGIPAGLPSRDVGSDTSFLGFGRPQRRAGRRYARGADPMLGRDTVDTAYPDLQR